MRRDPSLIPLSHHHQHGLAFCVLTERELAKDSSEKRGKQLAGQAVALYEVELSNHFEVEEQALFPALPDSYLLPRLLREHRQMESMIGGLKLAPTVSGLREFLTLLRAHIRLEENELFEDAQRRLDSSVLDEIGGEIARRAVRVCL